MQTNPFPEETAQTVLTSLSKLPFHLTGQRVSPHVVPGEVHAAHMDLSLHHLTVSFLQGQGGVEGNLDLCEEEVSRESHLQSL